MVMKHVVQILVLLMSFFLTSCMTTYEYTTTTNLSAEWTKQYRGSSYRDIIKAFGLPRDKEPDGTGGTVLHYYTGGTRSRVEIHDISTIGGTSDRREIRDCGYFDGTDVFLDEYDRCYSVKTTKTRTDTTEETRIDWGETFGNIIGVPLVAGLLLVLFSL